MIGLMQTDTFLEMCEGEADEKRAEMLALWGAIPPMVEVVDEEVMAIWYDDPRVAAAGSSPEN